MIAIVCWSAVCAGTTASASSGPGGASSAAITHRAQRYKGAGAGGKDGRLS